MADTKTKEHESFEEQAPESKPVAFEVDEKEQLTVEQLISKYHVDTWDQG